MVRGSEAFFFDYGSRGSEAFIFNRFDHTPHQDSKGGARGAAGAGARGNPHHPLRKGGPVYLGFLQYGPTLY